MDNYTSFSDWIKNGNPIIPTVTAGKEVHSYAAEPTDKESKQPKVKKSIDIGVVDTGVAEVTGEIVAQPKITNYRKQTVAAKNIKPHVAGEQVPVKTPARTKKVLTDPQVYENVNMTDGMWNVRFGPNIVK